MPSTATGYRNRYALRYLEHNYIIGSVNKRGSVKARYEQDTFFTDLLDKSGVDVKKLHEMYNLTPISPESVYKDFAKYHAPLDLSNVDWDRLEIGAMWLIQHKFKCMKRRPKILSYDAVLELIDKTKSATALWNMLCADKRDVLASEDFKVSFIKFLYGYATGEAFYVLWLAIQKEEIRPTEKIVDLKIRSIIVGSIYSLILGHMLYADMDDAIAEAWFDYRGGIGMSFFNGQYDKKISEYEGKPCLGFSDVGKYDSRQAYYLQQLGAFVATALYKVETIKFYDLLGSLNGLAQKLGFDDIVINLAYLRNRLIEDGCYGPVIMPDGTVVVTDTGEKSGNHRTGHSNTDRYKIVEFAAASKFFNSYKEYITSNYRTDQTGDDMIYGGETYDLMDEMNAIWKTFGCDIETHKVSTVAELEYLGSNPVLVEWGGLVKWMPRVNSSKILAGLASKLSERTIDVDIGRLSSARVMCHFTEDAAILDSIISEYNSIVPQARNDTRWWTPYQINGFYFGEFESKVMLYHIINADVDHCFSIAWFQSCHEHLCVGARVYEFSPASPLDSVTEGKICKHRVKTDPLFSFKAHGNYCGPGWSAGKYQNSVRDETVPAVDSHDNKCLIHDAEYADPESDFYEADKRFVLDLVADHPFDYLTYILAAPVAVQAVARKLGLMGRKGKKVAKEIKKVEKAVAKGMKRKRRTRPRRRRGNRGGGNIPAAYVSRGLAHGSGRGFGHLRSKPSKDGQSVVVTGTEFLGAVTTTGGLTQGDTAAGPYVIAPQTLSGTRLQTFSSLYEKYKILSWRVEYVPTVGTATAGNLVMYVEPDPLDPITNGIQGVRKAMGAANRADFAVYQKADVSYRPEKGTTDLFTSEEGDTPRLTRAGYIALLSTGALASSTTYGNLILHYRVKFFKPLLEIAQSTLPGAGLATMNSVTGAAPFGGSFSGTSGNTIQLTWLSGTSFSFAATPTLNYTMIWFVTGTGISTTPTFTVNNGTISYNIGFANGNINLIYYVVIQPNANVTSITVNINAITATTLNGANRLLVVGAYNLFNPGPPLNTLQLTEKAAEYDSKIRLLEEQIALLKNDVKGEEESSDEEDHVQKLLLKYATGKSSAEKK